mgnify:FL=1
MIQFKKKMTCKLCDRKKKLQKSHIIPEFVYRSLYDEKHKFHVLSKSGKLPPKQKGIYEKLLCVECEQQLSVYEKYAREMLIGGEQISYRQHGKLICLFGLDYHKFKLFMLSILWRSSISEDKFFSHVQLGKYHENKIKQLIKNDNPGDSFDYPCVIFGLSDEEKTHSSVIVQPIRSRIQGHIVYRFVFSRFVWVYYVSSHQLPPSLSDVVIGENGNMSITLKSFNNLAEVEQILGRLEKFPSLIN